MWPPLSWTQIKPFEHVRLDIVGIVAILGEGSTARNAQASSLGWHHILPRLLPAPQALLELEHKRRLPAAPGYVVGAYSGNVRFELNWFCQLLHNDELAQFEVQYVVVEPNYDARDETIISKLRRWRRKEEVEVEQHKGDDAAIKRQLSREPRRGEQAYGVKTFGPLTFLSILGCCMSLVMMVLSIYQSDGPSLVAVICLSATSSIVGFASWWRLDFREYVSQSSYQTSRKDDIPHSDVVIYYPRQGAFRVVHCPYESISRLYFRPEACEHVLPDNLYRVVALSASILLMVGLLAMSNAALPMQVAFAACYIVLNAFYWAFSAINPTSKHGHWRHNYKLKTFKVRSPTTSKLKRRVQRMMQPRAVEAISSSVVFSSAQQGAENLEDPENLKDLEDPEDFENPGIVKRGTVTFYPQDPSAGAGSLSAQSSNESDSTRFRSITETITADQNHEEDLAAEVSHFFRSQKDRVESLLNRYRLINARDHVRKRGRATRTLHPILKYGLIGSVKRKRKQDTGFAEFEVIKDENNVEKVCEVPYWDYQGRLKKLFEEQPPIEKRRPREARTLFELVEEGRFPNAVMQAHGRAREKVRHRHLRSRLWRALLQRKLVVVSEATQTVSTKPEEQSSDAVADNQA